MNSLPDPDTYESEYAWWPWGSVISFVRDYVELQAPHGARVVDYMCGTGFLLDQIAQRRPDLTLIGCDIHKPFIDFARKKYPHLDVRDEDALSFSEDIQFDISICTGSLHHLNFAQQITFLRKLSENCDSGSSLVLAEEVIPEHSGRRARSIAAFGHGLDLIEWSRTRGCPLPLQKAAWKLLLNDVLLLGEFKRSLPDLMGILSEHFIIEQLAPIWKASAGGGDYVMICKKRTRAGIFNNAL